MPPGDDVIPIALLYNVSYLQGFNLEEFYPDDSLHRSHDRCSRLPNEANCGLSNSRLI